MIQTLIETARSNNAAPYYYLKYLMEQMLKHLYEKGRDFMLEMMPQSEKYRGYEIQERMNTHWAQAMQGNKQRKLRTKKNTFTVK